MRGKVFLSPLDRRLLLAIQRDPGVSIVELAQVLEVSARTAARALDRLTRNDVVHVRGRTLPTLDGALAQLARAHGRPSVLAALAPQLVQSPTTRWVRLSQDRCELICGVVPGVEPRDQALELLLEHPRLRQVEIAQLLHVWPSAPRAVERAPRELDDRDRLILAELAKDGRVESTALAGRLGVDASTVSRRRRRLIDDGVVYLEADIHPDAMEAVGDAMLWVSVAPGSIASLGQSLRDHDHARFVAATSGRYSLVANVALADRAALFRFVDSELVNSGVNAVDIVPMGEVFKRTA